VVPNAVTTVFGLIIAIIDTIALALLGIPVPLEKSSLHVKPHVGLH
jgi:hypothetical protein